MHSFHTAATFFTDFQLAFRIFSKSHKNKGNWIVTLLKMIKHPGVLDKFVLKKA